MPGPDPHVYLLARATVSEQAAPTYQAARTLGLGPVDAARRVVLTPGPAVAGGRRCAGGHGDAHGLRDDPVRQRRDEVGRGLARCGTGMFDRARRGRAGGQRTTSVPRMPFS
jgi:hypothetical protein